MFKTNQKLKSVFKSSFNVSWVMGFLISYPLKIKMCTTLKLHAEKIKSFELDNMYNLWTYIRVQHRDYLISVHFEAALQMFGIWTVL